MEVREGLNASEWDVRNFIDVHNPVKVFYGQVFLALSGTARLRTCRKGA